jgi:hypothetical protein
VSKRLEKVVNEPGFQRAIARRDINAAMAFFTDEALEELTGPFTAIMEDILAKGGKYGQKVVNDLTRVK